MSQTGKPTETKRSCQGLWERGHESDSEWVGFWGLYLFSMAAVTNYHALSGLKQHTLILSQFRRTESNEPHEVKIQFPSGGF